MSALFLPIDPTPLIVNVLGGIYKVVTFIRTKVKDVKVNKKQCSTLSQRIQRVTAHLQTSAFKKTVQSYGGALLQTLEAFNEFLNDCYQFFSTFVDISWIKKFFYSDRHKERFNELNKQLESFSSELTMGISVTNLINKEQDEQDRSEDQRELIKIINHPQELLSYQQHNIMSLQQALFQHQNQQINQWGWLISNQIDQLRLKNQTATIVPSLMNDGFNALEKPDIGFTIPPSSNALAIFLTSEDLFVSGTWANRYFQYGGWHGPFKHQMTFNSNNNTFEGSGEDDVGQFILSGTFSKDTKQVNMIQSYKYGTGNPLLNSGHQCRFQLIWNRERRVFEGIIYVPNGWMIVPGGLFEMLLVQAA